MLVIEDFCLTFCLFFKSENAFQCMTATARFDTLKKESIPKILNDLCEFENSNKKV